MLGDSYLGQVAIGQQPVLDAPPALDPVGAVEGASAAQSPLEGASGIVGPL